MEIKSISQKIFKTAPNKIENNNNHTNPFGVSFKGNIISADVFDAAEKTDKVSFTGIIAEKVGRRCKMLTSAAVGSIGDMSSAINARLNSVVSFGRKIGNNISRSWNYLNTTNVSISFDLVKRGTKGLLTLGSDAAYSPGNLRKQPVSVLKDMLKETIAAGV